MIINLDKKAYKYVKDNNIDNIVIQLDCDSKGSCCGLGSVDIEVFTNAKHKIKNFKQTYFKDIEIFYEPSLEFYFNNDEILNISLIGIFKFKKLYVNNEINILK